MKPSTKPVMPKHRLDSFVIGVCVRYRKGMPIENAIADAVDDFSDLTSNAVSRIRKSSIKELKKNSDWRY